jgi:ankyrin repeat protein
LRALSACAQHLSCFAQCSQLHDLQGQTALHIAVTHEHEELIKALVANGADANLSDSAQKDKPGQTPIQLAKTPKILALLEPTQATTTTAAAAAAPETPATSEIDELRAEVARLRAENEALKAGGK